MIWKLYVKSAKIFLRSCSATCFSRDSARAEAEFAELDRVSRMIRAIRQCQNTHPAFVKHLYGDLNGYLKQHLSHEDWSLWAQLNEAKPESTQTPPLTNQTLDIA